MSRFIDEAEAATAMVADRRRVRRQHARLVREAEVAFRAPLIREIARQFLDSGVATSESEARHLARREVIKGEIATETRKKLPAATDLGIQRCVAREMDIRAAVADRADEVRERLEYGYCWSGGEDPATGFERNRFVYEGLRSDEHPHLKLFAACLPKARPWAEDADESVLKQSLMAGGKEFTRAAGSKLLALDKVYVEGQKSVRGFIRVDCDREFASWDACRLALLDALDEDVALMPHLAVGAELSDGRVLRPHFIWLLPAEMRVRFDKAAFAKPKNKFQATARALTAAMIPIGGDPGGLLNSMRVKNPLSPHWGVAIMNARDPLSLDDLSVRLEPWMGADDPDLNERYAAVHTREFGIPECRSNEFFRTASAAAWALARQWVAEGDDRSLLRDDDLAEAMVAVLGHDARHALAGVPPKRAMGMLRSVCRWSAHHFDPTTRRGTMHAGALRGQLDGLDLRSRQAAGGRHGAATRRDASLDAIRSAIDALAAEGIEVTKRTVADRAGVAYRTVLRRWDEAVAAAQDAPIASVKTCMTNSLCKIARLPLALPCLSSTLSPQGGSVQGVAPSVMSATATQIDPDESESPWVPTSVVHLWHSLDDTDSQRTQASRPTVDDDEDDDVVALIDHELWLASQNQALDEPPPWVIESWLAVAA